MNKRGDWTLSAILGIIGVALIVGPLAGGMSKWWILLGILFLYLAFLANK